VQCILCGWPQHSAGVATVEVRALLSSGIKNVRMNCFALTTDFVRSTSLISLGLAHLGQQVLVLEDMLQEHFRVGPLFPLRIDVNHITIQVELHLTA